VRRANGIHEFHRLQSDGVDAELLLDADGWPALDFPYARSVHTSGRVEIFACWSPAAWRRVTVLEQPALPSLSSALTHARELLRSISGRPAQALR
jgi:hypothetical protein